MQSTNQILQVNLHLLNISNQNIGKIIEICLHFPSQNYTTQFKRLQIAEKYPQWGWCSYYKQAILEREFLSIPDRRIWRRTKWKNCNNSCLPIHPSRTIYILTAVLNVSSDKKSRLLKLTLGITLILVYV